MQLMDLYTLSLHQLVAPEQRSALKQPLGQGPLAWGAHGATAPGPQVSCASKAHAPVSVQRRRAGSGTAAFQPCIICRQKGVLHTSTG